MKRNAEPLPRIKVTNTTRIQEVTNENGNIVKRIFHQKPFRNSGSSLAFMARHGIRPSTVVANGFKPPKGVALKLEKELIKSKKSKLSRREREIVMGL